MKKLKLLFLFFTVTVLVCCAKKLFFHVEVKGTVMDYFSNKPIPSTIKLYGLYKTADPGYSEKLLETVSTDGNGNFKIRTKAMKSEKYFIIFQGKTTYNYNNLPENVGHIYDISIEPKKTKDFGQLFESTHTFYCKAIITHTSSLPYDFYISDPFPVSNTISFHNCPTGTSNTFTYFRGLSKTEYEESNHTFIFHYGLSGPSIVGGGTISLPIQNNKDTVYTTIEY
ncbi:MAG: hypothetical protein JNJ41_10245 [Bacteroidia bacterium]|nr:hypothetical protein [Bacteroidia bacterium]